MGGGLEQGEFKQGCPLSISDWKKAVAQGPLIISNAGLPDLICCTITASPPLLGSGNHSICRENTVPMLANLVRLYLVAHDPLMYIFSCSNSVLICVKESIGAAGNVLYPGLGDDCTDARICKTSRSCPPKCPLCTYLLSVSPLLIFLKEKSIKKKRMHNREMLNSQV